MPKYIEKIENYTLPIVAVRGTVAFPGVSLSFELDDEPYSSAKVREELFKMLRRGAE